MRRRAVLAGLALLIIGCVVALVAGSARADSFPPDIPKPPGCTDPWDCYRNGAYDAAKNKQIVTRIQGWGNVFAGDGGSIKDYYGSGRTVSQHEYLAARLQSSMRAAGAAPTVDALVADAPTLGSKLMPFVKTVGGVATVALTGYLVYKLITTDHNGQSHTTYVSFRREALGGALVTLPNGYSYTADPASAAEMAICTTRFSGAVQSFGATCKLFGWEYTPSGLQYGAGNQAGWVFNYTMGVGAGSTCTAPGTPGDVAPCRPGTGSPANWRWAWSNGAGQPDPIAGAMGGPDAFDCGGIETTCWGSTVGSPAGIRAIWGMAATMTRQSMNGSLNPLPVSTDLDAKAAGHIRQGVQCSAGAGFVGNCQVTYVKALDMNRLAPREIDTTPKDTPDGTKTFVAADPTTAGGRTATTDELADSCGRAIFNHMVMPNTYQHYECDPADSDPSTGDTTPLPNDDPVVAPSPTFTPFALPEPLPYETYPQYIQRLRERGWVGTATTIESGVDASALPGSAYALATDTSVTGIALSTGSVLLYDNDGDRMPWPINPPQVTSAGTSIQLEYKPEEGNFPNPNGSPGSGTPLLPPINVPDIDFGPLTAPDWCGKFPVGVFCWAGGVLASFNVGADAPRFDFNHPLWGDTHYIVDLEVLDPYVAIIRGLLTFCMWVGAIWWIGTRMLGFNASGDPGAAIDDGNWMTD